MHCYQLSGNVELDKVLLSRWTGWESRKQSLLKVQESALCFLILFSDTSAQHPSILNNQVFTNSHFTQRLCGDQPWELGEPLSCLVQNYGKEGGCQ